MVHLTCNLNGVDLTPGELVINTCDQHIYLNHIDSVKSQLERKTQFPKLMVKRKVERIEDLNGRILVWKDTLLNLTLGVIWQFNYIFCMYIYK